jgi:hypothetical protein
VITNASLLDELTDYGSHVIGIGDYLAPAFSSARAVVETGQ